MTSDFEPSSLVQTAVPVSEPPRCQAERNQWMGPSRPWHWAWSTGSSWTARPCVSAPGCMPIVVERIALWGLRPVGRGGRVATVCNPRGGGPENLDVGQDLGTSRQAEAAIRCRGAALTWSPIFPRLVLFVLSLFASMIVVPYARGGSSGEGVFGVVSVGLATASILPRVRWKDPVREARWGRRVVRAALAISVLLGTTAWWNSGLSWRARNAANALVYSGCQCGDCIGEFGFVSRNTGGRRGDFTAGIIGAVAVATAVAGLRGLPRTSEPVARHCDARSVAMTWRACRARCVRSAEKIAERGERS